MSIYHDTLRTVEELADLGLIEACWTYFADFLQPLDISVNDAAVFFMLDYTTAKCRYTDLVIPTIGKQVAAVNAKKYEKMLAIYAAQYDPLTNYDRTEESTHTRTPDLTTNTDSTATSETTSSTDTDTKNNQTRTTTTTPQAYTTTTTKQVAPFDSQTYKPQEQDTAVSSGTLEVSETYSGQPDTVSTSAESTNSSAAGTSTTETGTETTEIDSHIVGNIGVTTSQQMAEQELALAEKMAIFRVYEQDLAAKLLLQIW